MGVGFENLILPLVPSGDITSRLLCRKERFLGNFYGIPGEWGNDAADDCNAVSE